MRVRRSLVALLCLWLRGTGALLHIRTSSVKPKTCFLSKLMDGSVAEIETEEISPNGKKKGTKRGKRTSEERTDALLQTQAATIIAVETSNILSAPDSDAEMPPSSQSKPKKSSRVKKPVPPTARELSGFNFTGFDKESGKRLMYEVPFIDQPRWSAMLVHQSSPT